MEISKKTTKNGNHMGKFHIFSTFGNKPVDLSATILGGSVVVYSSAVTEQLVTLWSSMPLRRFSVHPFAVEAPLLRLLILRWKSCQICRISWHASHFSSQLVGMADPKRIPKIKQFGILGIILHLNPKKRPQWCQNPGHESGPGHLHVPPPISQPC